MQEIHNGSQGAVFGGSSPMTFLWPRWMLFSQRGFWLDFLIQLVHLGGHTFHLQNVDTNQCSRTLAKGSTCLDRRQRADYHRPFLCNYFRMWTLESPKCFKHILLQWHFTSKSIAKTTLPNSWAWNFMSRDSSMLLIYIQVMNPGTVFI